MSSTATPLHIVMPVTLEGSVVRLEPICREHAGLFWDVAKDALDDIFQWIPYPMKSFASRFILYSLFIRYHDSLLFS